MPAGSVGHVAGCGLLLSGGAPSKTLKEIDLPVEELDSSFHPFVRSDKFFSYVEL